MLPPKPPGPTFPILKGVFRDRENGNMHRCRSKAWARPRRGIWGARVLAVDARPCARFSARVTGCLGESTNPWISASALAHCAAASEKLQGLDIQSNTLVDSINLPRPLNS